MLILQNKTERSKKVGDIYVEFTSLFIDYITEDIQQVKKDPGLEFLGKLGLSEKSKPRNLFGKDNSDPQVQFNKLFGSIFE